MQNLSVSFSTRNLCGGFNRSRKFLGEISRRKAKFPIKSARVLKYFEREQWFREEATIKGLHTNPPISKIPDTTSSPESNPVKNSQGSDHFNGGCHFSCLSFVPENTRGLTRGWGISAILS
jgi:hypothetical protein